VIFYFIGNEIAILKMDLEKLNSMKMMFDFMVSWIPSK
jgi:RNA binding exosome subunit